MADLTDRLLAGPSYVALRTRLDLLGEPEESPEALAAKSALAGDPQVGELIAATSDWFADAVRRHDDARLSHYLLPMLADFGFDISDHRIAAIVDKAPAHTENGLPAIRQALPDSHVHVHGLSGPGFRRQEVALTMDHLSLSSDSQPILRAVTAPGGRQRSRRSALQPPLPTFISAVIPAGRSEKTPYMVP